ncbi:translational activator of cytochrome c oxidase 1 isoform X1 [Cuculus canorus]|uniref:translational activator of cytochrome c oxidase 1 isoform X1 n=1 Tax=Cuculus canorus TaxID=55661 RepID=UPI0023AADD0D|nr:translational activator of cytochrome c oxidase 1 isoform X1 [Cuculus canorus]XP_053909041.1 translational activator of cytochrome c oxidase 1 isoform X1 [Cuculus canorus]
MAAVGPIALRGLLVAPRGPLVAHRGLHSCPRTFAGHNRWSKVRNVKGPRDAARGHRFQRLAAMLRLAARGPPDVPQDPLSSSLSPPEGGPDPSLNAALANVMAQCRSSNMPKATMAAAIGPAHRSTPELRFLLEVRGPSGTAIVVDVLTDNARRTHHDLRLLLSRYGATLAEGVKHGFEERGVIAVDAKDLRGRAVTMEAALEAALEAGAHDVLQDEHCVKFLCSPSALQDVRNLLEALGLRPLSATVELFPRNVVNVPEETQNAAQRLLRALSDHPDVLHVYHNLQ